MPIYAVQVTGEAEGIAEVAPSEGRRWGMTVTCGKCQTATDKFVYVEEGEEVETAGGGTANFEFACKFCKNSIRISICPRSAAPWKVDEGPKNKGVIAFDFRGATPLELELDDQWVATSTGGTKFEGCNLDEDWSEYDEKNSEAVSIMEFSAAFVLRRS